MSAPGPGVEALLLDVFRDQLSRLHIYLERAAGGASEDLTQEVFLRAWDHRESLESPSGQDLRDGIRRYLWRVARNLAVDEIRRRRRIRGSAGGWADGLDPPADAGASSPEERLEREDALRAVRETAARLPDAVVRQCLDMWLHGFDLDAIARETGCGIDQVRGRLQRGRAEVVRRVADRLKAPPPREGGGLER